MIAEVWSASLGQKQEKNQELTLYRHLDGVSGFSLCERTPLIGQNEGDNNFLFSIIGSGGRTSLECDYWLTFFGLLRIILEYCTASLGFYCHPLIAIL